MGLTAARVHGAAPRRMRSHGSRPRSLADPSTQGSYGRITFVRRDIDELDLVRIRRELADGWVTSIEQTAVDLLRRPDWGGSQELARDAVADLLPRCDRDLVERIAAQQRGLAALKTMAVKLGRPR